ncbi:DUF5995 family protein [Rhodococcus sp. IEGM 1379]|uniref:DUF5995 family protein n=1 Tax=Rhodococcus sp. IEGM 1379 TaxID=3047086 RepID=UPI0024B697F6|nr:DUF5995 family protein [Rhodococcus sp. IEGM 1379]MDI9915834.1 DUF5995 family protein [Rhodococcus sp. IEGM 1379]
MKSSRFTPLAIALGISITLLSPGFATAEPGESLSVACGTPLAPGDVARIADLSDVTTLRGEGLERLETAVERHHQITTILVSHHDWRGLFSIGLDAVEHDAVMPLQRDPASFADAQWAHSVSYELLRRYLVNVHAEFTGTPTDPAWSNYFALTRQCGVSPARVAMAGYNAHLTVDLAHAVEASGTQPVDIPDYYKIVDSIAVKGGSIVTETKTEYNADLGPLWRFYFLGEGLDKLAGTSEPSQLLLRAADSGYNTITLANGFALQNPQTRAGTEQEIDSLWRTTDTALGVLSQVGGL